MYTYKDIIDFVGFFYSFYVTFSYFFGNFNYLMAKKYEYWPLKDAKFYN